MVFEKKLFRSLNSDEPEDPNADDDFIFQVTGFIIQMIIILFFFWEGSFVNNQWSITIGFSNLALILLVLKGPYSKFLLWMHRIDKTKD